MVGTLLWLCCCFYLDLVLLDSSSKDSSLLIQSLCLLAISVSLETERDALGFVLLPCTHAESVFGLSVQPRAVGQCFHPC